MLEDRHATALYLYPMKAVTQDQLKYWRARARPRTLTQPRGL